MPADVLVPPGDPKAIKKYSALLGIEAPKAMYWTRFAQTVKGKAMANSPLQIMTDLESGKGDKINYDLVVRLQFQPVEGSDVIEGKEADLTMYSDEVRIDLMRCGVKTGDTMSKKRTIHDLRKTAKTVQGTWWGEVFNQLSFMYASGARGINPDFHFPTTYTGFAGNQITAPDSEHIYYANGKAKSTLTSSDTISFAEVEFLATKAKTMNQSMSVAGTDGNVQTPKVAPITMGGEKRYILLMSSWQAYDLRTNSADGEWLDITKALTQAVGKKSPIFTNALGMRRNVILHENEDVIRFNDYGSGGNVEAARALLLGRQAVVLAYGDAGKGMRYQWIEDSDDRGEKTVVVTRSMFGMKKSTFNGKDIGVIAYDTACQFRS